MSEEREKETKAVSEFLLGRILIRSRHLYQKIAEEAKRKETATESGEPQIDYYRIRGIVREEVWRTSDEIG